MQPFNTGMLNELSNLLGERGLIRAPNDKSPYEADLIGVHQGQALAVARPQSTDEVAAVVRLAAEHAVVLVPQGGNTGFCGGSVPDGTGDQLILSLDRMSQIREIDPVSSTMTVEAGCPLVRVREEAEAVSLDFPVFHGGISSQIGGNLATNAGGNNVLRHGMTRNLVLGLEVVLADGQIWNGLRKLPKSNVGYDLKQLFIGSEGTLGVITAAVLRLTPLARARATTIAAIPDPAAAVELLGLVRREIGELVTAFELIPRSGLDLHLQRTEAAEPFMVPHGWQVLIELESASTLFDLDAALETVLATAMETGLVTDAVLARSEAQRSGLWSYREGIALAQVETHGNLKNDTAVPISAIPDFIEQATAAVGSIAPGAVPVPFGHIGDGNIHFNINPPPGSDSFAFVASWPDLTGAIEEVAVGLGGSFSAEHGVGTEKLAAAERYLSPIERELMAKLKTAIDPADILNRGKVIPARR